MLPFTAASSFLSSLSVARKVTSVSLPANMKPAMAPMGPSSMAPATPKPMASLMLLIEPSLATSTLLNEESARVMPGHG
ncbi:hypothetical protein D3C73_1406470 [compost metagenome]